jgi:prepilin-type N-terminal cleavage/methylation domain-containing protein
MTRRAFTLIELLIVVAIISILASIAVPNFLEAQTRARVARARNDMRVVATGLESYRVDSNAYPPRTSFPKGGALARAADASIRAYEMGRITSPIAYLSSLPRDLFETVLAPPNNGIDYWPYSISEPLFAAIPSILNGIRNRGGDWTLMSVGPDGSVGFSPGAAWGNFPPTPVQWGLTYRDEYDPSNGTISGGNLYRFQSGRDGTQVYQGN